MMKRLMAMLLCMVMLLSCAGAEGADYAMVEREWRRVLKVYEQIRMTQQWMLSNLDDFLESGAWADLRKARLAACSASVYLASSVTVPEPRLTEADYLPLMLEGADLTFVRGEFNGIGDTLLYADNDAVFLSEALEFDVFWQYNLDHLKQWSANQWRISRLYCEMIAIMSNALTLHAPDPAAAQASLAEAYPTLFAGHTQWLDDDALLQESYAARLDELTLAMEESAALVGVSEANYLLMEKLYQSGDMDALRRDAVAIEGLPLQLPVMNVTAEKPLIDYQWIDTDQEGYFVTPGLRPGSEQTMYQLYWKNVPREAFDLYIAQLAVMGVSFYRQTITAEEHTILVVDGEHAFFFTWMNNQASFYSDGADICFVPAWYLDAGV